MTEHIAKIVNGLELLTTIAKNPIIDVWHGPKYASVVSNTESFFLSDAFTVLNSVSSERFENYAMSSLCSKVTEMQQFHLGKLKT